MMIETASLEGLEHHVRSLAAADSAPAVFRGLLDAMKMVAPSGAIFLVRQGQIKGWNGFGYGEDAAARQKGFSTAAPQGWLANPEVDPPQPDFGQGQDEMVVQTAAVRGRPIALVVVNRSDPSGPWSPEVLSVLVTVAQLRLAYTLLEKKLAGTGAAPTAPAAPKPAATSVADDTAVAPSEQVAAPTPEVAAAERFARLVATDIRLYNEDGVMAGRREGDLVERLSEELSRGKEAFLKRHGSLGPVAIKLLRDAFVQVLAGGDENLIPDSLFD